MTFFDYLIDQIEFNRAFTLRSLDRAVELGALGWRPGSGRAHCAWQFMHIAATEEKFATQRYHGRDLIHPELIDSYGHGSTPVDEIPSVEEIKAYLAEARTLLINSIRELEESQLDVVPETMADRGWTYKQGLQLLSWHEDHHQGQCHITLNLFANQ